MTADDILAAIGDVAALAAAVFAFLALDKANETIKEARAERREAEHDRLVRRIERVAEAVQKIDALADNDLRYSPPTDSWLHGQNGLSYALVGLAGRLPNAARLLTFRGAPDASSAAVLAREEIGRELERLAQQAASGTAGLRKL